MNISNFTDFTNLSYPDFINSGINVFSVQDILQDYCGQMSEKFFWLPIGIILIIYFKIYFRKFFEKKVGINFCDILDSYAETTILVFCVFLSVIAWLWLWG